MEALAKATKIYDIVASMCGVKASSLPVFSSGTFSHCKGDALSTAEGQLTNYK